MKCSSCGFENREGAKFCKDCGLKLDLACPKCGQNIESNSKFCDDCGHKLSDPKPVTIDYSQPQSYTPKPLAEKILKERKQIEGERKLVTVFFADVKGFTTMSEKLDPEIVHGIVDGWYKIVMDEIHRYEGTITQFMGDGVMALFGAPLAHEDHARRACLAALAIQENIKPYSDRVREKHGVDFKMRVGLNSGLVIVTSIGDDLKMDYTAIGDTVNMASRMETAAEPGKILVSESTHHLIKSFFETKSLGKIEIKGKSKPQEAYEIVSSAGVSTRLEASIARGLTRFVGRKDELDQLLKAFDKAKSGAGQVVSIVGEAGVGKSRLLYELRQVLSPGEYTYLEGRCLQYGGGTIYLPVLDVIKSYFEIIDGKTEAEVKATMQKKAPAGTELAPLQDLLSMDVDDADYKKLEPKIKRERTFDAIKNLLISIGKEKPLIVAVEDLHWMDKTSEEFLTFFINAIASANVLLITLYRPEYQHQWGGKTYYNRISLDQLKLDDCAELVRSILEDGEVAPELRNLILGKAAGNPLFMEELTHALVENGSVEKRDNRFCLSCDPKSIDVPDTIQGIIAARMDRLEDNLKRTMQVASVIGRDFAFRILHSITEMKDHLKSHLTNLQGLEFIYEKNLFPELEYIFKHALTQEVAYNSLLIQRRKELHERIGRAIEELYPDRLDEFYEMLAYHFERSENWEKAADYYKKAGEKASNSYSIISAFGFFKAALRICQVSPKSKENIKKYLDVVVKLDPIMTQLMYPENSSDILREAEELANDFCDSWYIARICSAIGMYYSLKGDTLYGGKYAERSFFEARKIQDLDLMASAAFSLSTRYLGTGQIIEVINITEEVLQLIELAGRKKDKFGGIYIVYSMLSSYNGAANCYWGKFNRGKAKILEGIKNSQANDDIIGIAWGYHMLSLGELLNGDIETANKNARFAEELLKKSEWDWLIGHTHFIQGAALFFKKNYDEAREKLESCIKILTGAGSQLFVSYHYYFLSLCNYEKGDLEKATNYCQTAIELCIKHHEWWKPILKIMLSRIKIRQDKSTSPFEIKFLIEEMLSLEGTDIKAYFPEHYFYMAEIYTEIGEREKAFAYINKCLSLCEEIGMMYWPDKARTLLERLEK